MKALLSDIHGNLEALEAVMEDAVRHQVDGFYCLGDVVGYGPNPRECLDVVMGWEVVLLGNFDLVVLAESPDLGPAMGCVNASLVLSRAELNERHRRFLKSLPKKVVEGPFLFVHGSPHHPTDEYLFPEDVYNLEKMNRNFALVERYCFMGHSHVPGVFTEDLKSLSPDQIDHAYQLDGRKTLLNVGSVGQPRDGDWRACYVLLDGDVVRFRRIEYDVDKTVAKIRETAALDNMFGDRLRSGR